jgi:hypothetical protein
MLCNRVLRACFRAPVVTLVHYPQGVCSALLLLLRLVVVVLLLHHCSPVLCPDCDYIISTRQKLS